MHHFFIHSPNDGPLYCFHILAVINNAIINVCIYMAFQFSVWVSSNKYPEVELLGPSLFLSIAFVLQSILSSTSIATPDFLFCFHFHDISFSILSLLVYVCLLI